MIEFVERKSMLIRKSGRSTDFISPSFGHGCLYNCTYCYMKRHKPEGLSVATNTDDILNAIDEHRLSLGKKQPNQTHQQYWTYDISCNEDFALHLKHHDWFYIFNYFCVEADNALGSFATKYVNKELLNFNPNEKIRVRMSLIPEPYRVELEPNTSDTTSRILFLNELLEAGYEAHINFSPVVVYPGALKMYELLFHDINKYIKDENKSKIKCEVIFLTHNKDKHEYNMANNLPGEHLIWRPVIQRTKKSQYGGINLRYEPKLKRKLIKEWTDLHNKIIPWNTIRYIF